MSVRRRGATDCPNYDIKQANESPALHDGTCLTSSLTGTFDLPFTQISGHFRSCSGISRTDEELVVRRYIISQRSSKDRQLCRVAKGKSHGDWDVYPRPASVHQHGVDECNGVIETSLKVRNRK